MSKVYYCTKVSDFRTCGETDPIKFEVGRYSTCKSCRNKIVRERTKERKVLDSEETHNKTDPSHNIRNLIMDIIKYTPIMYNKSIIEKFEDNDNDISEVLTKCTEDLDKYKIHVKNDILYLSRHIEFFDEYRKQTKNEISNLMEEIKELKKEIFDLKNSKNN
jgi:hypothetical protein